MVSTDDEIERGMDILRHPFCLVALPRAPICGERLLLLTKPCGGIAPVLAEASWRCRQIAAQAALFVL
jgi:hypothetical protein